MSPPLPPAPVFVLVLPLLNGGPNNPSPLQPTSSTAKPTKIIVWRYFGMQQMKFGLPGVPGFVPEQMNGPTGRPCAVHGSTSDVPSSYVHVPPLVAHSVGVGMHSMPGAQDAEAVGDWLMPGGHPGTAG